MQVGVALVAREKRKARERLSQLSAPLPPARCPRRAGRSTDAPGRRRSCRVAAGALKVFPWAYACEWVCGRGGGALSRRQFDQSTPCHVRQRGGRAPCFLQPSCTSNTSDGP